MTPCYNGNISRMQVGGVTDDYTYDHLNRLTACASSDGYNTTYSYNLNSSPVAIGRSQNANLPVTRHMERSDMCRVSNSPLLGIPVRGCRLQRIRSAFGALRPSRVSIPPSVPRGEIVKNRFDNKS